MNRLFIVFGIVLTLGFAAAQTLTFGASGLPSSLDMATDGNSLVVSTQVLEHLLEFEPGTTNLVPGLATAWSANDEATVWTFELREGVTFQDGTPFDAEAVKFNIDRWNQADHAYGFRDEGKTYVPWQWIFGGFDEDSLLEAVEVVDDHTIELRLREPAGFLPAMIASSYFGIHSPTAVREAGPDYGTPGVGLVGTGPFEFQAWSEGDHVMIQRNDGYWGEPAGVQQIVFRGIEEPTVRLAELRAGAIDIAIQLAPDDYAAIEADPDLAVVTAETDLNVGYLAMHQAHEPFDDERVRQAVAHAIDRAAIVDAFYEDLGSVAEDFLPPAMWGHPDDVESYEFDPERARELLTEAGYPNGFDTELWYMPVSRPYFPVPQPIATTMATYLADVGINAELMTEDWGSYLDHYNQGAFPMYMLGWKADFADPDNFLYTFFGPAAPDALGWEDPETVDILDQARSEPSQDERAALYQEASRRVHEAVPALPVAHNTEINATTGDVVGFIPGAIRTPLHLVTMEE